MKHRTTIQTAAMLVCGVALLLACQLGMSSGIGKVRIHCAVPEELTGLTGKAAAKGLIGPALLQLSHEI